MKTVFLRVLEAEDKGVALLDAVHQRGGEPGRKRFEVDPASFAMVPRSPFAYWVGERLRRLFKELPPFESEGRTAKQGLATADDFRFVRAWWAVPARQVAARWFPIVKGGAFSPYYSNVPAVVNWARDGAEDKAYIVKRYPYLNGNAAFVAKNTDSYFQPGITWPLRGVRFSAQAVPRGCIFSVAGKMAFAEENELLWFLALFNSRAFDTFIAFFAGKVGGVQYEAGLIQSVPVPRPAVESIATVRTQARRAWLLKRSLDTSIAISRAFTLPALLQISGADFAARSTAWSDHLRTAEAELVAIQAEIDARCFELYDIESSDQGVMTESLGSAASGEESGGDDGADEARINDGEVEEKASAVDAASLAAALVSWAVKVALGHFDVRLATGVRAMPIEPEPFDPLPLCSPGMLIGDDGLPPDSAPAGYPLPFPETGVLVDDLGDAQDLTAAVRAVFDAVFKADADRWWSDVAEVLDLRSRDLRGWLSESLFDYHLKGYSKSRRRAPILWQLGTPSRRYSVWLYAHRLTRDTFFQLQNDVVGPKLAHAERQLTTLIQAAGGSPSTSQRKEIATQEAFVEELRTMLEEVRRVAPLWNPNLDDGVVLTMAPLWRLVSQHKGWQKELKAKWDELAAGKYDWAHLAMHLWPERVVPKCATDRSLAIAHGLEDEFWEQDFEGGWKRRQEDQAVMHKLVTGRTSAAVKEAIKLLLGTSGLTTEVVGNRRTRKAPQ